MAQLPIQKRGEQGIYQVVGHVTVDEELAHFLEKSVWTRLGNSEYVARRSEDDEAYEYLHHVVWMLANKKAAIPDGHGVRHQDGDRSNFTSANLELVTNRVKMAHAPKQSNNTTGFKDVALNQGKYNAQVQRDGKAKYVGRYATAEQAAYAVNLGYSVFHPEVPPPNTIPEGELSDEEMAAVEDNVRRLLRPDREPHQP